MDKNSIDFEILEALNDQLEMAENEILGGDIQFGTRSKVYILGQIVSLCRRNKDVELLAEYGVKYAKEFPKVFDDPVKLSKFKHLNE